MPSRNRTISQVPSQAQVFTDNWDACNWTSQQQITTCRYTDNIDPGTLRCCHKLIKTDSSGRIEPIHKHFVAYAHQQPGPSCSVAFQGQGGGRAADQSQTGWPDARRQLLAVPAVVWPQKATHPEPTEAQEHGSDAGQSQCTRGLQPGSESGDKLSHDAAGSHGLQSADTEGGEGLSLAAPAESTGRRPMESPGSIAGQCCVEPHWPSIQTGHHEAVSWLSRWNPTWRPFGELFGERGSSCHDDSDETTQCSQLLLL